MENNYHLDSDENIIIKEQKGDTYFNVFSCNIQYFYRITEPDLDIYNEYPEYLEGDSGEIFEKREYIGRISTYKISLNAQLSSSNCRDKRCQICYQNQVDQCLHCRYGSEIITGGLFLYRDCFDQDTTITEAITDMNFDESTEKITEKIIDTITEEITEKITEKITDAITEETTEIITEKINDTITDGLTETNTEKINNAITDEPTETNSEKINDTITDEATEKITEKITIVMTDEATEKKK